MLKAILLDLDDTLLANDMARFLPRYFGLLQAQAAEAGFTFDLVSEVVACTNAVITDTNPGRSNRDVFWDLFSQRTGLPRQTTEAFFERFYVEVFPQLEAVTQPDPAAPSLVRWCQEQGWRVVVATNPLFPTEAVAQRLAWAGLPVEQFEFDLVTTFDNMHAAKPQPAYYQEILTRIDVPAQLALMVGDDWGNDIIPAAALGCATYWISPPGQKPPDAALVRGHGSLAHLAGQLRDGWLQVASDSAQR